MTDKNLLVSGTAITLSVQGLIKLPKRKFYNTVFFNDTKYRHEIANHYRDFKLRRRIRQHRKRSNLYDGNKRETIKNYSLDYQQELPMALHVFPSFEKVCIPRGQQKYCEQRTRPVLIYNDTIKRIQSAKENTELLKNLAKKQVERLKHQNLLWKKWSSDIKTRNNLNICKVQQNKRLGKLENKRKQQFKSATAVQIQRVEEAGVEKGLSSRNVGDETLKYYLQATTDFYEKSFLRNIKYLEELKERNQFRQTQQQKPKQKFHAIDYLSGDTDEANSFSVEHIKGASLSSSDQKQNQINQNNPILWHENRPEPNTSKSNNCAIRVNIKPQTLCAINNQQQPDNLFNLKTNFYGKTKTIQESKDFVSMNDYLNGNLKYTQLQQQQQQPQQVTIYDCTTSIRHQNYSEKVLRFDHIIENLKELDIQENRTNLPRITLTDYTNKYPNELDTNFSAPTVTQENEKPLNSYVLKPTSLNFYQLDIPRQTNFQSEARPP